MRARTVLARLLMALALCILSADGVGQLIGGLGRDKEVTRTASPPGQDSESNPNFPPPG